MPRTRRRVPRVRLIGAPISSVSSALSSSKCCSARSASFNRSCWRSYGLNLLHGPSKALLVRRSRGRNKDRVGAIDLGEEALQVLDLRQVVVDDIRLARVPRQVVLMVVLGR